MIEKLARTNLKRAGDEENVPDPVFRAPGSISAMWLRETPIRSASIALRDGTTVDHVVSRQLLIL